MARARRVKPDEQLTLVEHLDELRTRIIVVLAVLTVGVGLAFYKSDAILNFLSGGHGRDRSYGNGNPSGKQSGDIIHGNGGSDPVFDGGPYQRDHLLAGRERRERLAHAHTADPEFRHR